MFRTAVVPAAVSAEAAPLLSNSQPLFGEPIEERALFVAQLLRQGRVGLEQGLGVPKILRALRTAASGIAATCARCRRSGMR
jgi:hypothetical protein